MADTSKDFTVAERAILRNQRIMMLALNGIIHAQHGMAGKATAERLVRRVQDMDRNWEFIASPGERLVPFEQT